MDVSVLVRFRNEAAYLNAVLSAVRQQRFPGRFEIVAIDNCSTDDSAAIAARHTPVLLSINDYQPGKALNAAIRQCSGRHIAVLSAHTIPADADWLARLYGHMGVPRLAGVYGAQMYPLHSRFLDKRDLDIFSTLVPRVEVRDTDFWNANSMFPRAVWEEQPFDEVVYELEDHHWTKLLCPRGYRVHFEPDALVYHYSHIQRLDREHLPATSQTPAEQIAAATEVLRDSAARWPQVMRAGLTLSSLTDHPEVANSAVPLLCRHLQEHPDFDVRWRMAQALGKIPTTAAAEMLAVSLNDPSYYPRDEAAWSLARLGKLAVPFVQARLQTLEPEYRPFAALALGRSGEPVAEAGALQVLNDELHSASSRRNRDAAHFLGEIAHLPHADRLLPRLTKLTVTSANEDQFVYCWALGCFAQHHTVDEELLARVAADGSHLLARFEAVVALGKAYRGSGSERALDVVLSHLSDTAARVRYGAIQSVRLAVEAGWPCPPLPELPEDERDFGVRFEWSLARSAQGQHP